MSDTCILQRTGTSLASGTDGKRATSVYKVIASTPEAALKHPELPKVGDAYSETSRELVAVGYSVAPGVGIQTVTVSYESPSTTGNDQVLENTEYQWDFGLREEPIDTAIDEDGGGISILTPDGMPPIDQPTGTFQSVLLTVTRNEKRFNPPTALLYTNKLNDDTFFGCPPGKCKCLGIAPTQKYSGASLVINVTYRFEFRDEGFKLRVLNKGFYAWDLVQDKFVRVVEGDEPIEAGGMLEVSKRRTAKEKQLPVLLNADGYYTTEASFTEYTIYDSVPFGPLRLEPKISEQFASAQTGFANLRVG